LCPVVFITVDKKDNELLGLVTPPFDEPETCPAPDSEAELRDIEIARDEGGPGPELTLPDAAKADNPSGRLDRRVRSVGMQETGMKSGDENDEVGDVTEDVDIFDGVLGVVTC